jgi:hypothetical protein
MNSPERDRVLMAGTRDALLNETLDKLHYTQINYSALMRDFDQVLEKMRVTVESRELWRQRHNSCRLALMFAAAVAGVEFIILVGLWP